MSDIRDFIIDEVAESKKSAQRNASIPTYKVLVSNHCDVVIEKTVGKSKTLLALVPSKNLFYIKPSGKEATELTHTNITSFFKGLSSKICIPHNKWLPSIYSFPTFVTGFLCIAASPLMANMAKYGILDPSIISKADYYGLKKYYWKDVLDHSNLNIGILVGKYCPCSKWKEQWNNVCEKYDLLEGNIKLLKKAAEYGFFLTREPDKLNSNHIIFTAIRIKEKYGNDIAYYFLKSAAKSPVYYGLYFDDGPGDNSNQLIEISERYNLNIRRLIEYVFCDLYIQGEEYLSMGMLSIYSDYLLAQKALYGANVDKYPKYLLTQHNQSMIKYKAIQKEYEKERFLENCKKTERFEYTSGEYCIVAPKSPADLMDEHQALGHCIDTYLPNIAEGICEIVFLRKADNPNEPYYTIEIKRDKVTQMQGANHTHPTEGTPERKWLDKWAQSNSLQIIA